MSSRHPDAAYMAIVACWVLLLLVTIAGRIQGDNWDTVSDMITRSPRLRNAFAVIVGWVVVCQLYYVTVMYHRWNKIAHMEASSQEGTTPRPLYWPLTFALIGVVASAAGSVGFAIISTDISTLQHEYCAGTAFFGIYMYLAAFAWLAHAYDDKYILSLRWATIFLIVPVLCSIIFIFVRQHYLYIWEFVFITSVFGAACALYVYPVTQEQRFPQALPVEKGGAHTDTTNLLF